MKLQSPPKILINEVQQYIPTEHRNISYDLLLFAKKDASRTKNLLAMLNKEQEKIIYVDENSDWEFPQQEKISLFIDTSCMSRINMAEVFARLFRWLCRDNCDRSIELNLGYSLSRFSKQSGENIHMKSFEAVHNLFAGWSADPERDMELIVALGYEETKAWGAVEYLEVKDPWIFIPHSPEEQFLKEVREKNELLLKSSKDKTLDYRVLEPVDTFFRLKSLIWGLLKESKVILLPFGPKIFFALSLLLGLQERNLSIWYVDAEDDHGASLQASSHSVVFSCKLSKGKVE